MTVLSDADLRRIWPNCEPGPASVDLHLGDSLLCWSRHVRRDPRIDQARSWKPVDLQLAWTPAAGEHDPLEEPAWVLQPGYRYLATTKERIRIPDDCAGQLAARSSWGRDGLAVIQGPAGWCDPGYVGRPTLELSVTGSELVLWPGARCLQLIVFRLETPAEHPYRGKYVDDTEPTPSRLHIEVQP